ncbi:GAF and ANTAR domain-containing protein [Nocardia terpenica]|uniref:ANTAR domain-containing protein n=1 Tax=Nocardia terpenica TaxID=455432 RepID=UPI002FE08896
MWDLFGFSDGWARRLEEAQFDLGEGPTVDVLTTGEPISPVRVGAVSRWTIFGRYAEHAGAGMVASFPLKLGASVLGSLNLYGRRTISLSRLVCDDAAILAGFIASAVAEHAGAWGTAAVTMVAHHEVQAACGVIAARQHLTITDALAVLRAHAFASDQSLRQVASDLVAGRIYLDEPDDDG